MPTTGRHSIRRRQQQVEQGGRLYPEIPLIDIEMRDLNEQRVLVIPICISHLKILYLLNDIYFTLFLFSFVTEMEGSFSKGK